VGLCVANIFCLAANGDLYMSLCRVHIELWSRGLLEVTLTQKGPVLWRYL
jgi:hypothetical protein